MFVWNKIKNYLQLAEIINIEFVDFAENRLKNVRCVDDNFGN